MKIMHLLNTATFSGAENVVCQIADMFRGDENVEMLYCSRDGAIRDVLKEKEIAFVPLGELSLAEVRRVISEHKPDIIHAHDMRATYIASCVCAKIPLISHIHGNAPDASRIGVRSLAYLFASRKVKHIFWVSESSFSSYIFNGLLKKKSSVLPNVIHANALRKRANDAEGERFNIVYLGRMAKEKNPERFVRIVAKIKEQLPNIKAAMMGAGQLSDRVSELIKELGLQDNLMQYGFVDNPYAVLKNADIMMVTSLHEGMPIAAIEALTLGVPILSTPADGLCELVKPEYNGYLVKSDEDFVEKAIYILTSEEKLQNLKANAMVSSREYTNIDSYKNTILNEYFGCLKDRGINE